LSLSSPLLPAIGFFSRRLAATVPPFGEVRAKTTSSWLAAAAKLREAALSIDLTSILAIGPAPEVADRWW
jgi:hypothetical protein